MKLAFWALAALAALAGCGSPQQSAQGRASRPWPQSPPDLSHESEEVLAFLSRKERWPVKVGADPGVVDVPAGPQGIYQTEATTVDRLRQLSRPSELPSRSGASDERFGPTEDTIFTIDADILRYKFETDDQDVHIDIRDHGGVRQTTMVAEIPDPTMTPKASPFHALIAQARQDFYARFTPQTHFTRKVAHVQITGVGFFDFIHGQSGVAPNGIELHPVLDIKFY